MYVIVTPATILEIAVVEPKENHALKKIETPLNASESEPEIYGKQITAAKVIITTLIKLKVGFA